jgi:hypothetical protein
MENAHLQQDIGISLTDHQERAIDTFFSAVETLTQLGVIRSGKYLGDIAEFLCCNLLHMELAESKKQTDHDGMIQGLRCQVKFSGGASTTVDLGKPNAYDRLIIVLGPDSALRPPGLSSRWIIYNVPSEVVIEKVPHRDGYRRYTRQQIPQRYLVGEFSSLSAVEMALEKEGVQGGAHASHVIESKKSKKVAR